MFRNALARLQETHLATRFDRWMTGVIVVLLVAIGFLLGRWTSLTTNATPIVFQEAPGNSSAATAEELRALVSGSETAASLPASPPASAIPLRPAGSAGGEATDLDELGRVAGRRPPTPPSDSTLPAGAFVASVNGTKYYHPSCPEVRRIKDENKIWFDSAEEAKESGYAPSVCVSKGKKK